MTTDPDSRGPIRPEGREPVVARQSVQAGSPPRAVSPDDRGPEVGKWVWARNSPKMPVRFRKQIEIEGAPDKVRIWIAADIRYRLWVNGALASRGPADVGRDYDSGPCGPWFQDVRDLTRFFRQGRNLVAVEVYPNPIVESESPTHHPGLKVDLKIGSGGENSRSVGSDETWLYASAPDLNQNGANNGFRMDMRSEPAGWRSIEFDDSNWVPAAIASYQTPTLVSELAPPLEAVLPPIGVVRVTDGVAADPKTGGAAFAHDGAYSVRYGHVLSGYIGLKVRGHDGARLLIMPNEHDDPGHHRQAEIFLREGEQTLELPFFDSFSVINIKADGVRRPIEIEDVRCVFTSYPVRYLGSFSCSRPDFNRLWEVCRWCTQICMQTHHLDSPHHQEPVSDAGDYLIESLNSLYAFGEGTLARQDLKKIARTLAQRDFKSFHTSYSLLWLQMLMQYYDYTGDGKTVEELSPAVFKLLDRFEGYIGPNGLVSNAPNYMFMDWVEIEGFSAHHPPAVIGQGYMTSLYYRALEDGIRVATLLNDSQRAEKCRRLRSKIVEAFNRELWVPEKGLYRDGKPFQSSIEPNSWLPADKDIETFTTQGNSFAVACGLVPADRAREVMQTVMSRPDLHCQPYFMHFVFQALAVAGLLDRYVAAQMERWHIVPDTQTFLEMWDTGDLSHAWIGAPLYQMSGNILGVKPVEPGFKKFQIDPHPCGLEWAKGRVPTPYGYVEVSWTRAATGCDVEFTVPKGATAVVNGLTYKPGRHRATLSNGGR